MGIGIRASALAAAASLAAGMSLATGTLEPLPASLAATGLFEGVSGGTLAEGVAAFTPQYPLWSDGATKRRWIKLPPDGAIDGSDPAAWVFPAGTTLWKEFSIDGRRIETRMIERTGDGSWRFSAYVWNEDQTAATLAPPEGIPDLPLPGGGRYTVPGEADCRACHEGAGSPVLGFNALQLSPDRDPLAPHAERAQAGDLDLPALVRSGRLTGLPAELLRTPPRIEAPTPAGRAALGYLDANCGHCHADPERSGAAVPVDLQLRIDPAERSSGARTIRRLLDSRSRFRPAGAADDRLVVAGDAKGGALLARMRSRDPRIQMPPLGTAAPDLEALALIERWIEEDLEQPTEEQTP